VSLPADHAERIARARLSLEGLSLGDAFGERYFAHPHTVEQLIADRALARAPWAWTDDTAMALSIVEVLDRHAGIDADALAHAFARRYRHEPGRGYGGGAHQILGALVVGVPWPTAARLVFDGEGSMGNGGAMRVAPVGAYFADDLERVAEHASRSAMVTHAHPDGQAGAIAIAVAAAVAARMAQGGGKARDGTALVMVLHDINLALRYCDHVLLLYGDGQTEQGEITAVLDEARLTRLYHHPVIALQGPKQRVFLAG